MRSRRKERGRNVKKERREEREGRRVGTVKGTGKRKREKK